MSFPNGIRQTNPCLNTIVKNEPRIDLEHCIYWVKGQKKPLEKFPHFKCSQLRACTASLTVEYEKGIDGKIVLPLHVTKRYDRQQKNCLPKKWPYYWQVRSVRWTPNFKPNELTCLPGVWRVQRRLGRLGDKTRSSNTAAWIPRFFKIPITILSIEKAVKRRSLLKMLELIHRQAQIAIKILLIWLHR